MRIDKFLWCVRLFKTRSISVDQVRSSRVLMENVTVKPSREVKIGDEITIKRHGFDQVFEVLSIPKSRVGAKLVEELVKDITPQDELDKQEFLRLAHNVTRKKGLGRPTKKDRRDLDDFTV
ncbi:MAG TPA: RNA-binding protein [Cryomorphaceae bacterium]|nr:RNA-binding protein [Cryomorphaceae bacterium]|tara:strand:+ start:1090 stop:1452 length:363 start_codon:yes stop_codon:yes gene_type:complete